MGPVMVGLALPPETTPASLFPLLEVYMRCFLEESLLPLFSVLFLHHCLSQHELQSHVSFITLN